MLAVLKAGAAFVPLDAQWPSGRLRDMVRACAPRVVLSIPDPGAEPETVPHAPPPGNGGNADTDAGPATLVVDLDRIGTGETGRFGAVAGPGDLAYGFYTSGSTGVPKCALNLHRGLLNRFLYMTRRFPGGPPERVLQNSRHTFDSSLWQLLWPLTHGGTVVIPETRGMVDLTATVHTIERHRVTMTDFVPTIFNSLVELLVSQPDLVPRLGSLRRLLIGGEEINARAIRLFHTMLPDVALLNTYGPTEAAIGSVFHDVTRDTRTPLPIGRPIDNTWAAVLDDRSRPVEPGEIGEIHIGGDCLGAGYLNDPRRTGAAFVANPFPELPGTLMYRTGDLGHHDADGLLFFDGRRDQQFKIGGVRVESAEVEHAIATHPHVRDVKVLAHEHAGSAYLAAFVTVGGATTAGDLMRHAREALPAELVPKRFVMLEAMPVNGNGKADRRALARLLARPGTGNGTGPGGTGPGGTGPASVPSPGREARALLDLWSEVLPEPVTDTGRDFFDSGGDSLSAQRLALAIANRFRTPFSVRDVVAAPTVTAQLALLGAPAGTRPGTAPPVAPGISPATREHAGEEELPPDVRPVGGPPPAAIRHVLLTGVTGFVGAHLLHEILRLPGVTAYCLVRASGTGEARRRVERNLRHYGLWHPGRARRLHVLAGDLSAPGLGLAESRADDLASRVDTVIHAGALVNLIRGYDAHRPANVTGTVEILRFATRGRTKAVHFVSTLAAHNGTAGGGEPGTPGTPAPEEPWPAAAAAATGYGRSKWAAEQLVLQAARRGLPVAVHRLGEVMPATGSGVPNAGSRTDLLIRACLHLGVRPVTTVSLDYTPVDTVGELLTAAVVRHERGWFHLLNSDPVPLDGLLGAFGSAFALEPVGYAAFWHALADAARAAPGDRTLAGALALLPAPGDAAALSSGDPLAHVFQDGTAPLASPGTIPPSGPARPVALPPGVTPGPWPGPPRRRLSPRRGRPAG